MDKKKKERKKAENKARRLERDRLKNETCMNKDKAPEITDPFAGEVVLEKMAAVPSQYPEGDIPEIAFAGRSNVGKSSLLNLICGRKKLAYVSGNPGKTRTINFFNVSDIFRIVDLPGYGYAKVSKTVSRDWGDMMETYFQNRPQLKKVVQLVDIRHEPTAQDIQMYGYLRYYGLDGIVAATKSDKVPANQIKKYVDDIRTALELSEDDKVIPVSALNRKGHEKLIDEVLKIVLVKQEEER